MVQQSSRRPKRAPPAPDQVAAFAVRPRIGGLLNIYRQAVLRIDRHEPVVLLLVIDAAGSTPQRVGAKALVDGQGRLLDGTIGGGLMESEALALGAKVAGTGSAQLREFRMDEPYSRQAGPICGGSMRILAADLGPYAATTCRAILAADHQRRSGLILTTLSGPQAGRTCWFDPLEPGNGTIDPVRGQTLLDSQEAGTILRDRDGAELFVEPLRPAPRMLIVGGGHVGQQVAQQAAQLGFEVTVLDDRPEFARQDRFCGQAQVICGPIGPKVAAFPKQKDTFIVMVSKGHRPDAEGLEGCIGSDAAYIGLIGSRRKIALLRQHFLGAGLATAEQFDRVFAPIGLSIGAVTVQEIATSIMAQVVCVRRRGAARTRALHVALT